VNWLLKVGMFKLLSALPRGGSLYHWAQWNLTRSPIPTQGKVRQKIEVGIRYLLFMRQHFAGWDYRNVRYVDIGVGWAPIIPLLFFSAGVDRLTLCDIRRHLTLANVVRTIQIFRRIAQGCVQDRVQLCRMPPLPRDGDQLDHCLARMGMRYVVPYRLSDVAGETGPKLISAAEVLLYLVPSDLESLLRMMRDALKKDGGVFMATIHLYDLWSDVDRSISRYNKYRYSEFVWNRLINSRLMAYNRFTASDYRACVEKAGLEIIEFHVDGPKQEDLEELRRIRVHKVFYGKTETELAGRHLFFAATVPSGK